MILNESTTSTIYVTQKRDWKLSVKIIAAAAATTTSSSTTITTVTVIITLIPTLKR